MTMPKGLNKYKYETWLKASSLPKPRQVNTDDLLMQAFCPFMYGRNLKVLKIFFFD